MSLERLYTSVEEERRPVKVEFTPPEGWEQDKPGEFYPAGEDFLPEIELQIHIDHQDDLSQAIEERLAKDRTKAVSGGKVTVVKDEEVEGGWMLICQVDSRNVPANNHLVEMLCYLPGPEKYVVTVQGTAKIEQEEEMVPIFESACKHTKILGVSDAPVEAE